MNATLRAGRPLTKCFWRARWFWGCVSGGVGGDGSHVATAAARFPSEDYDYSRSTEDNYAWGGVATVRRALSGGSGDSGLDAAAVDSSHERTASAHGGRFGQLRAVVLDHSYHGRYIPERVALQDAIVELFLPPESGSPLLGPTPWLVLTAGAMGAGKTRCARWLIENGLLLPETAAGAGRCVTVDPDLVRDARVFQRQSGGGGVHCPPVPPL